MQRARNRYSHSPEASRQKRANGQKAKLGRFPTGSRLNIVDPEKVTRLRGQEAIAVYVDRYRGATAGKPVKSVFLFREEPASGKVILHIEPLNYVTTPEVLIEKLTDVGRVLAGGFLDSTRMHFTIVETEDAALIEFIARAFGATHPYGVEVRQFVRSEIVIGDDSKGWAFQIVESFGLDFSDK